MSSASDEYGETEELEDSESDNESMDENSDESNDEYTISDAFSPQYECEWQIGMLSYAVNCILKREYNALREFHHAHPTFNLNSGDQDGHTLLEKLAEDGNFEPLPILKDFGFWPYRHDHGEGNPPNYLLVAVEHGKDEFLDQVFAQNIEEISALPYGALRFAVKSGNPKVLEVLKRHGFETTQTYKFTAFESALGLDPPNPIMVDALRKHFGPLHSIIFPLKKEKYRQLFALLNRTNHVDIFDYFVEHLWEWDPKFLKTVALMCAYEENSRMLIHIFARLACVPDKMKFEAKETILYLSGTLVGRALETLIFLVNLTFPEIGPEYFVRTQYDGSEYEHTRTIAAIFGRQEFRKMIEASQNLNSVMSVDNSPPELLRRYSITERSLTCEAILRVRRGVQLSKSLAAVMCFFYIRQRYRGKIQPYKILEPSK
jgi:hypothetical protein